MYIERFHSCRVGPVWTCGGWWFFKEDFTGIYLLSASEKQGRCRSIEQQEPDCLLLIASGRNIFTWFIRLCLAFIVFCILLHLSRRQKLDWKSKTLDKCLQGKDCSVHNAAVYKLRTVHAGNGEFISVYCERSVYSSLNPQCVHICRQLYIG